MCLAVSQMIKGKTLTLVGAPDLPVEESIHLFLVKFPLYTSTHSKTVTSSACAPDQHTVLHFRFCQFSFSQAQTSYPSSMRIYFSSTSSWIPNSFSYHCLHSSSTSYLILQLTPCNLCLDCALVSTNTYTTRFSSLNSLKIIKISICIYCNTGFQGLFSLSRYAAL